MLTIWSSITCGHRVIFPLPQSGEARALVDRLRTRREAGEARVVIERTYPFEAIADAYRCEETEQKTGTVAIKVEPACAQARVAC